VAAIAESGAGNGSLEDEDDLAVTYRTLLEQIPAIVYVWGIDEQDDMVEGYVSPQIEAVLGFRPEEWMADPKLWVERLHPDDRDEVLDETARSVQAGEPFKLEYRMIARDGRVVWLHDVASMVARNQKGRATRYQGVQIDITARKEAEHAQREVYERLRLVESERRELARRLMGAAETERLRISEGIHDETMQGLFRVLGRLGVVTREHPELEQVEGFSMLTQEIRDVIDGLRHLAFELHPRLLDERGLRASLASLLDLLFTDDQGIRYELDYRLTDEPSAEASLALYRAAQEALSNASRHSSASTVTVVVDQRAGGVVLRVEDDGQGFEMQPTGSLHLGLASMRERAEILGGRLQIESDPGNGARVEFWLPGDTIEDDISDDVPAAEDVASLDELSRREQEVAELLALGHTNQEIAAILHLSVRTIEHHRSRVFQKIGVRSRAGLVQALADRRAEHAR
jgi:two-component system, NarL family, sensor histidine kinase UhpB